MKTKPPLVVWRFTDGKPGHEKQTQGLCQALASKTSALIHVIPIRPGWRNLAYWLGWPAPYGKGLPRPHLLMGAGHATHLPMLAARRQYGGKVVVLMRPSLPLSLFDLCLIPAHDAPPARDNVVPTLGALNNVQPSQAHDPRRALVLVGGPSPHFQWDSAHIARQIQALAQARPALHWRLTTSRRTPASFLAAPELAGLECHAAAATPPGWLEAQLAQAGEVWVTPDSVSMVYEALTAGCRVGLLHLPPRPGSRVARSILGLAAQGMVAASQGQALPCAPPPPPPALDEARRCADIVLARWFA